MADLGLLQKAVAGLCDGSFDAAALIADAGQRREESPHYHVTRSQQARSASTRFALAQAAVDRYPSHWAALQQLARAALDVDDLKAAFAALDTAEALQPAQPAVRLMYSRALERAGRLDDSIAVMEALCHPQTVTNRFRLRLQLLRTRRLLRWRAATPLP